ncbi:MAG: DUF4097 family beta strand repeat protein [Ruminococcus sp.]|nr:DUF4097 family beta strand repeat protein [Ruminococcus sp.]MBQ7133237.1 DUF4097 family beta strand repeat protein [Ruminococcus sp.]
MTDFQRAIKYIAIIIAVFLIIAIIGGIISGLSILGFVVNTNSIESSTEVLTTQPLTDIYELEVELASYELIIKEGDTLSVAYDNRNKSVVVDGNTLKITEKKKLFHFGQEGYTVILTVPENYFFTQVSLKMGAGRLKVDALSTNELNLELGAGNVEISNLTAITSVDIEGGAGDLSITESEITDLDLQMGVGALALSSNLIGNNQIDLGVGDSDIKLKGTENDYRFDITKGLGEVTFDGEKFSNASPSVSMQGDNISFVEINCGVGKVNIDFIQ